MYTYKRQVWTGPGASIAWYRRERSDADWVRYRNDLLNNWREANIHVQFTYY